MTVFQDKEDPFKRDTTARYRSIAKMINKPDETEDIIGPNAGIILHPISPKCQSL